MLNVISIIQCIDQVFTNLIFIPMIFVLYVKFRPKKPWTRRRRNTYLLCLVLISLFLLRIFCEKFIFMPKLSSVMPSLTTGGKLPVTAPCSVLWTKHHLKMNISIIVICFPTRIHKQLTRKRTQTRPCFLSI